MTATARSESNATSSFPGASSCSENRRAESTRTRLEKGRSGAGTRLAQWSMTLGSQTKRAAWIAVGLFALWGSGCAGAAAQTQGARTSTSGTMQDIVNLQADIVEQQGIMAGDGSCQDRCRAVASICDSAGRICEVASDLAEVEALQSCRRAESICHESQVRVDEGCDCP